MKQSVTTQVSELTSTFQPETMMPISVADMELTLLENLNYGTLSSKDLQPDPSRSCIVNAACIQSATVGSPVNISVKDVDHFGNTCINMLSSLEFGYLSEIEPVVKRGQLKDSQNCCIGTFTPTIKGQHQASVKINGQHVTGSPFTVHVKSSVENLGDQISRIDGVSRPWGIVLNKKREIIVSESNSIASPCTVLMEESFDPLAHRAHVKDSLKSLVDLHSMIREISWWQITAIIGSRCSQKMDSFSRHCA